MTRTVIQKLALDETVYCILFLD